MVRWHTLAAYFRRKYGMRVQKIPLDAGSACPNRDGLLSTRGCVFCNALGSGSGLGGRGLSLAAQWQAWRQKYRAGDPDRRFLAYLQSFSNTYGSLERLQDLLHAVAALPDCCGLAVGTRPDCLSPSKLDALLRAGAEAGVAEIWLELGLQSAHDATLARVNRGHTAACAAKAVAEAAGRGLLVCGHLMAGLPGEGEAELEELCVFLRETKIERAGVFPFSPEEGTRAAQMDHVDMEEARRRAELVVDVQSDIIDAYNESVLGTEREVLCEGFDSQAQMHFGRSYAESPDIDGRIWFDADREVEPGTFVTVRLTGVMDGELTGELAEE